MKLPIENVTEGFVVKVYEDEVYIDVPEHQIDYMARMGIARDPDNTYLFAVKSDLHTKNAFQMSNPRFSICSGVNKITKEQFMKYVFGGNYVKKEVVFQNEKNYVIQYSGTIKNDPFAIQDIVMGKECIMLIFSNKTYKKIQEYISQHCNDQPAFLKLKQKVDETSSCTYYSIEAFYFDIQEERMRSVSIPEIYLL